MWQVIFLLCSDMYMAAREYANAVDIMGENGWVDRSASIETTVDVCMSKYLLSLSWILVFMKNEVFVLNMRTHICCVCNADFLAWCMKWTNLRLRY